MLPEGYRSLSQKKKKKREKITWRHDKSNQLNLNANKSIKTTECRDQNTITPTNRFCYAYKIWPNGT